MYCDNDSKNTLTSLAVLTKHNMINTIRSIIPPVSPVSYQLLLVNFFKYFCRHKMYSIKPQVISSLVYSYFLMQSREYIRIFDDTKLLYSLVTFITHFERN